MDLDKKANESFEGWGLTRSDKLLEDDVPVVSNSVLTSSDKLLKVEVPVVSNAICQAAMDANVSFNSSYSLASSS